MPLKKRTELILSLGFRSEGMPALSQYFDLLWEQNKELNLFSRKMSQEELVDNHVVDCLLPLKMLPVEIAAMADFGSGGGLPGVLYALQFPGTRVVLYEKSPLKQEFLKKCQKLFAPNLEIFGEIPRDLPGIELVTARAFKPLDVILQVSSDYFKKGGKYFLLKGRREKIEEEILACPQNGKNLKIDILRLTTPLMEVERHLLLVEKARQA